MTDAFQLVLLQDKDKRQTLLQDISTDECIISRFNTRKTRTPEQVIRLAERMHRQGFELTRALWAYRNGAEKFEVFAGGTRLEAARQAGVKVPVVLFEGYDEIEISRLADQDNENDEYHEPVSIVDTWAEYARLADEEGWTQERIAQAKRVSQAMVSQRISLHRMSNRIKEFIRQGKINEWHLIEISGLLVDKYFGPWLTSEQAWLELAELSATGVTKNGKKTVRATGSDVKQWREFVAYAKDVYRALEPVTLHRLSDSADPKSYIYDAAAEFVSKLAELQARSLVDVKAAERAIRLHIANSMKAYTEWTRHASAEASRAAMRARLEGEVLERFVLGNCLDASGVLDDGSVRLLLFDPPYGQDYQSNRRWRTDAPPKLVNDKQDDAMSLLAEILDAYLPKLAKDAHVLIFCNWQNEPQVRAIVEDRLKVRGSLIWAKEEHSSGDLDSAFGPSHERIIHATKGKPLVRPRLRDVFEAKRDLTWPHPTVKPVSLLTALIGSCTVEGDLVADPTAGIGSTLVAAQSSKRQFWGCELDSNWHQIGCSRLLEGMNDST